MKQGERMSLTMITAYCVIINSTNVAAELWQQFSESSKEISDVTEIVGQFLTNSSTWQIWAATTDKRKASGFYLTLCAHLGKQDVLIEEIKVPDAIQNDMEFKKVSDFEDGSSLIEAVSGRWYRCMAHKGTMLLDWSDDILLNIHVSTKRIDVLIKGEDEVFRYVGDLSVNKNEQNEFYVHLFSKAIDYLHFLDKKHIVSNDLNKLASVIITLDPTKDREWQNSIRQQNDE